MYNQPYCISCISNKELSSKNSSKSPLIWNTSYSAKEDYDYNIDGVVHTYTCSYENCNAQYDLITLNSNDAESIEFIKYCYPSDENTSITTNKEMISNCFYCSNALIKISQLSSDKIQTPLHNNFEGIKTVLKCSNCNTEFEVIDSPLLEEDLYEYRSIFIK